MRIRLIILFPVLFVFLTLCSFSEEIDLIDRASQAAWLNSSNRTLGFGSDGGEQGTVKYVTDARLEDGKTYPRVLFTHPEWKANGTIIGRFENIQIPNEGGKIVISGGFMEGASGTDGVTFSVHFYTQDQLRRRRAVPLRRMEGMGVNLASFKASYNRRIDRVERPLTEAAGQTGSLLLMVNAGNNANSDWAVWTEARLILGAETPEHPEHPVEPPPGSADARMIGAIKEHSSRIEHSMLSPNGRYLLTEDAGGTAIIWQLPSGREALTFRSNYSNPPAFSPDSRYAAVGTGGGAAEIWDVNAEERWKTLRGHSGRVHSACFSPNGRYLVTAGADGFAKIWDVRSGRELAGIRHSDRRGISVYSAVFMPDGRRVITSGEDGVSRIWELDLR